jgi:hypothetical protein
MNQRGQVTLFVIIAIVVVGAIAGYLVLKNKTDSSNTKIPAEIQPVYDYVSDCIKQSGDYAINKVSFYGGYNSLPSEVLNINSTVPYWVFDNNSYVPSQEFVNSELSKAFMGAFPVCINEFKDLSGFKVTASVFSVKSSFSNQEVGFELNYPLKIVKAEETFNLDNFNEIKISSKFGAMYNVAKEIAESSTDKYLGFCITCAGDALNASGLYGNVFVYDENSSILVITPENSDIENVTIQFDIALGY